MSRSNPHYKVFSQDFSARQEVSVVVAVLEATTPPALDEAGRALADKAVNSSTGRAPDWEVFDLLYAVTKQELPQGIGGAFLRATSCAPFFLTADSLSQRRLLLESVNSAADRGCGEKRLAQGAISPKARFGGGPVG